MDDRVNKECFEEKTCDKNENKNNTTVDESSETSDIEESIKSSNTVRNHDIVVKADGFTANTLSNKLLSDSTECKSDSKEVPGGVLVDSVTSSEDPNQADQNPTTIGKNLLNGSEVVRDRMNTLGLLDHLVDRVSVHATNSKRSKDDDNKENRDKRVEPLSSGDSNNDEKKHNTNLHLSRASKLAEDEDTGMVLFPVAEVERSHDEGASNHSCIATGTQNRAHNHNEHTHNERVNTVIEELTERRASASTTSLLAIDVIHSLVEEDADGVDEASPVRNVFSVSRRNAHGNSGSSCAEDTTGEGDQVWSEPHGHQLHGTLPESVEEETTAQAVIDAVVGVASEVLKTVL